MNILTEDYFSNLCSCLCEPITFPDFQSPSISLSDLLPHEPSSPISSDLMQEYKQYLESHSKSHKEKSIKTPLLAELLIKQGEHFCRDIWPGLSIRSIFLKNCNINEAANGGSETLPVMTEMEGENNRPSFESKKTLARDFLGYDIPDLSFMLANSIQWPQEYLKQI